MTYVIAKPCIGEKNGACVDVCPAGCIHTTPDAPQNYIDPDVCIECEQCVLVCPVDAVFLDTELPAEWERFIAVNAAFFQANKPVASLQLEQARRMTDAVLAYAARAGLDVAVAVLDGAGSPLLLTGAEPADEAVRKAYTALMYGVATHELKPSSKPLWRDASDVDRARVLFAPGGTPVVEGVETLGAIGVAGATPADLLLCCQVALTARRSAE